MTADLEFELEAVLCVPFSYVSTVGPVWRSRANRQSIIANALSSHLLVRRDGHTVGAVSWTRADTPGFFRLSLLSSDDDAWTSELARDSLRTAATILARSTELRRLQLTFGSYNEVVAGAVCEADDFVVEGILRDRYFIDGRYWPGLVCRAHLQALKPSLKSSGSDRQDLMAALGERAGQSLTELRRALREASP